MRSLRSNFFVILIICFVVLFFAFNILIGGEKTGLAIYKSNLEENNFFNNLFSKFSFSSEKGDGAKKELVSSESFSLPDPKIHFDKFKIPYGELGVSYPDVVEKGDKLKESSEFQYFTVALDGTGDFDNIQDAIDAADSNYEIFIKCGEYPLFENIFVYAKYNLTIGGEVVDQHRQCVTLKSGSIDVDVGLLIQTVDMITYQRIGRNITVRNLIFKDFDKSSLFAFGTFIDGINDASGIDYFVFENNVFHVENRSYLGPVMYAVLTVQESSESKVLHNRFITSVNTQNETQLICFPLGVSDFNDDQVVKYNYLPGNGVVSNLTSSNGIWGTMLMSGRKNVISNNYYDHTRSDDGSRLFTDENCNSFAGNNEFVGLKDYPYSAWDTPHFIYANGYRLKWNNFIGYNGFGLWGEEFVISKNFWDAEGDYVDSDGDGIMDNPYNIPNLMPNYFDDQSAIKERSWLGSNITYLFFEKYKSVMVKMNNLQGDFIDLDLAFGGYLSMIDYIEEISTGKRFLPANSEYTLKYLVLGEEYKIIANSDFSMKFSGLVKVY